ncbi:ribonuclease H-like domain-containing protein [Tanacetum coccineum]
MTPTQPPSYQFLDDNLDTSPIALRLLTTPTSPQQTPPQTTPQTTPQATPQTTPPTLLPTPSPLNTTLPPNTPPPDTLPPPPPPSTSKHPMVTHSKVGIMKAKPKYNFHVTTSSLIPKSPFHALRDPNRKQAISRSMALSRAPELGFNDLPAMLFELVSITAKPTPSSTSLMQRIISSLHEEFAMTDLDPLNYFLGISSTRTTSGIFLSQKKYATEILKRAQMLNCNPCRTPVDTEKKIGPEGSPVTDPTLYRSLTGALQYLTFTRPDLSYAVQQLCLYMHDPREPHLNAMKRVLRYFRGTTDLRLQLFWSTTSQLIAYSDADWAGCPAMRRSTSGYCVFLGDNLLTWSSKCQDTLSRSCAEAEYRGVANAVAETSWIRNLLRELYTPLSTATLVYCDNVSVVYMSANPVQHHRTKHIEIDIHFVRDKVAAGHVRVLHVPSRF